MLVERARSQTCNQFIEGGRGAGRVGDRGIVLPSKEGLGAGRVGMGDIVLSSKGRRGAG